MEDSHLHICGNPKGCLIHDSCFHSKPHKYDTRYCVFRIFGPECKCDPIKEEIPEYDE